MPADGFANLGARRATIVLAPRLIALLLIQLAAIWEKRARQDGIPESRTRTAAAITVSLSLARAAPAFRRLQLGRAVAFTLIARCN